MAHPDADTGAAAGMVVSALRCCAVAACVAAAAACAGAPAAAPHACRIDAWVADRDAAGLNVRAAPAAGAAVLGTLPPHVAGPEGRGFGVPVRVSAALDGWFRIEAGRDDPERSGLPARPTYAGSGWVAANLLRFRLQSGTARAAPDERSAVLVDLGDDDVTDFGSITQVHDCRDDWVQVDLLLTRRRDAATQALRERQPPLALRRAWLRGVCANQETSCDQRRP